MDNIKKQLLGRNKSIKSDNKKRKDIRKKLPLQEILTTSDNFKRRAVWVREVLPPIVIPTTEGSNKNTVERTVFPIFINDVKGNNLTQAINNYFKKNNIAASIQSPKHATILNSFFKLYMDIRHDSPEIISGSRQKIKNLIFTHENENTDAFYNPEQSICINLNNPILDLSTNTLLHEIGHALDINDDFQTQLTDAPYFQIATTFWRRSLGMLNLALTDKEREECFPFLKSIEGMIYMSDSIGIIQSYNTFEQPAEFIAFLWEHLSGPNRAQYESLIASDIFLKNAITVWKATALFNTCSCQKSSDELIACIDNFNINKNTYRDMLRFDKKLRSVLAHSPKDRDETISVLRLYQKAKRALTRDGKILYKEINNIYQKTKKSQNVITKINHLHEIAQSLWDTYQKNQNNKKNICSHNRLLPYSHPEKQNNS